MRRQPSGVPEQIRLTGASDRRLRTSGHGAGSPVVQKGVQITRPVSEQGFGLMTSIGLPDGGELALYQPSHPTAR